MIKKALVSISRRNFIKFCYMLGISSTFPLITNCGWIKPSKTQLFKNGLDDAGIDTSGFQLYNGKNPNQKHGHQYEIFRNDMRTGGIVPGHVYRSYDTAIYAAQSGIVTRIYQITRSKHNTNIGGNTIEIADTINSPYRILYAHVEGVKVNFMDQVKRGDLVAKSGSSIRFDGGGRDDEIFKIVLYNWHNVEDPDNYGINHGPMNYWDGKTDLDVKDAFQRRGNQRIILSEIVNSYRGDGSNPLAPIAIMSEVEHRKRASYGANTYRWSEIERFRFLEHVRNKNHGIFDITDSEFQGIKDKFYANQPIVLTLPFKRKA
jgi:hypothetical protein